MSRDRAQQQPPLPWLAAAAGILLCLAAQLWQSAEVARLGRELESLRDTCGAPASRGERQRVTQQVASVLTNTLVAQPRRDPAAPARSRNGDPARQALRVQRDSEGKRKRKEKRKNSLIHLVPSSYRSQGDSTVIHWQTTLHTGQSFEQNNSTIAIKRDGYYFIYTQVLYRDHTFIMGHVVKRKDRGWRRDEETLLRCARNMPEKQPFNTCYSAGIYRLQKGDIIELVIPRHSANIVMEKDSTFMGLLKVGPI
uniref:tumor necrosis factor ligand superfamily member 13 n=1 Tax=Pristiophorus japonicus TaxID=55135 RepID=UPI00398EED79